jgi:anti-anti-sigma factor
VADPQPDAFRARTESAVIRLRGDFDDEGVEVLHQALTGALRARASHLVVDLTDVTSIERAALAALLRATRLHPDLRLRGASDDVHDVIESNGLGRQFTFEDA